MILQQLASGAVLLMLLAGVAGALLAVAYLVMDYLLVPTVRLHPHSHLVSRLKDSKIHAALHLSTDRLIE